MKFISGFLAVSTAVFFSISALVPQAGADPVTVNVGDTGIRFEIPDGHCLLNARNPNDSRLIEYLETASRGMNTFRLAFAECGQLKLWRAGRQATLDDYGYVATPLNLEQKSFDVDRKDFVALAAAELGDADLAQRGLDEGVARANDALERQRIGAEVGQSMDLGLLHTDANAAYSGSLLSVAAEDGTNKSILAITGVTLLRGKVAYLFVYSTVDRELPKELPAIIDTSSAWAEKVARSNRR